MNRVQRLNAERNALKARIAALELALKNASAILNRMSDQGRFDKKCPGCGIQEAGIHELWCEFKNIAEALKKECGI